MSFKLYDKVFHKYYGLVGVIDAITSFRIRIRTKEKGYIWVSQHEIEPYTNQTCNPKEKIKIL